MKSDDISEALADLEAVIRAHDARYQRHALQVIRVMTDAGSRLKRRDKPTPKS